MSRVYSLQTENQEDWIGGFPNSPYFYEAKPNYNMAFLTKHAVNLICLDRSGF